MAGIGGRNTAKRKIQIRKYIAEQFHAMRTYSDPFLHDESEGEDTLKPRELKFSFKGHYKTESTDTSDDEDEILSSKVNLDEADRFIAALKLPKRKKQQQEAKQEKPAPFVPLDLTVFKEETEKLEKIRMRESQGESDESEEQID